MNSLFLNARAAKVVDGLHPFQRTFAHAVDDPVNRVICVEAPVGAGKSHIVRTLLERPTEGMNVLTYPTKILMETQLAALKDQFAQTGKDLRVWPKFDNEFRADAVNVVNYSTDSVLHLLKNGDRDAARLKRGELILQILNWQNSFGRVSRTIATTPDVLHLISRYRYSGAKKNLVQWLIHGLFVFDEFHLYYNLRNFVPLLEKILSTWNGTVVLLSATPIEHEELGDLLSRFKTIRIPFAPDSTCDIGETPQRVFNYPLEIKLESFKTSDLQQWPPRLGALLPTLQQPTAVILDSVHRVQWLRGDLEVIAKQLGLTLVEWSGLRKDRFQLDDKTILLGTSAIEVGIDMRFKSLIFEATYWPSAIQRLGRVGRHCDGSAVIFSRQVFESALGAKFDWDRTEFEEKVLKEALREPQAGMVGGEMFRGDSYPFAIIDVDTGDAKFYDETIFSMFKITDAVDDWRSLDLTGKSEALRELGCRRDLIDGILLRDRVFPFLGALKGSLRPDYVQVYAKERDDEVEIIADQSYFFEMGKPLEFEADA